MNFTARTSRRTLSIAVLFLVGLTSAFQAEAGPAGRHIDDIRRNLCRGDVPVFDHVNSPEEKEANARLLFRYRQLWNLYTVRNDARVNDGSERGRAITALATISREPCLTSDQPSEYVRAEILKNSSALKQLLTAEVLAAADYSQRLSPEANLNYLNNVVIKGLKGQRAIYSMSKRNFKAEFKNMMPTESVWDTNTTEPVEAPASYSQPQSRIAQ